MNQSKRRPIAGSFLSACLCLTCVVGVGWTTRAATADEAVFVAKGDARSVREIGKRWTRKEGALVCGGMDNFLVAGKAVGAGDFQIRARLSLHRLDGTAASLVIGGNHFGFDGHGRKFFVEGPAFGRTRLLGDAGEVIRAGKPFDVEVARKGTRLSFRIDGKEIHSAAYRLAPVCTIALRPWRATMRLHEFSASGKMTPLTEAGIKTMQEEAKPARRPGTKRTGAITVGGVTFDPASPPKPLVLRRNLGLVTAPAVDGQLVHESKRNLFETRATITPGGDYLLMFPEGSHYGGHKGKVNNMIAYRSCDKGKAWTGPKVAFDIDYSQHGFIPLIPRGTKRIYAFGTQPIEGKREGRENCPIGFRFSDDDGHTWSGVTLIRPTNNPGFLGMSVMRMCETDAGTWLLGSHEGQWKRTPKTPVITRAYVLRSDDKGKTWTVHPKPRPGGWYLEEFDRLDEPRPINLGGGKAMILARSCEGHLWEVRSDDDGRTWGEPKPTTLVHPDAPPMLFHLADGKTLAAFHHNRDSGGHFKHTARSEIWVSLSTDEGRTWSEPRFVFANALPATSRSAWHDHQCSYMDAFADGEDLHLFVPHRWKRALHLHLEASDLKKLPTRAQLRNANTSARATTFGEEAAADLPEIPFVEMEAKLPKQFSIPTIDLSGQPARQVVVDKDPKRYFGHPSTLLMPDRKTMYCAYSLNHGGPPLYYKVSRDSGLTWSDHLPAPPGSKNLGNCPFLHRLKDPRGTWRLFSFVGGDDGKADATWQSHTVDGGETWTPMKNNGMESVVAPPTIVPVEGGRKYLCWYHTYPAGVKRSSRLLEVRQSASADGGLTWGETRIVCRVKGAAPCEPGVVRSPDGKQLLILMRENARRLNSLMMVSNDEGRTWSPPRELPAALTGDRHQPRYAPDGRLVITFRDKAAKSPTRGHFVAWVGTYDDIVNGREGQYRVKLLHQYGRSGDCGYSGLELLPDGTLVATTYVQHKPGEKNSIISVRFKLYETDAIYAKKAPKKAVRTH